MSVCSCLVCSKIVYDNQSGIFCDCCHRWVHLKCTCFTYNEYNNNNNNFYFAFIKITLKYIELSKNAEDWFCQLCIMTILPFNHLNDYDFHIAIAEFSLGPSKIHKKDFSELHINPTITLNILDKSNYILDENNDPDIKFYNQSLTNGDYLLDNELNSLLQNIGINTNN